MSRPSKGNLNMNEFFDINIPERKYCNKFRIMYGTKSLQLKKSLKKKRMVNCLK